MEELYIEGLAVHGGPDHALATGEGAAKRWIGAGWAIEPRNQQVRGADAVLWRGRQHRRRRFRESSSDPAGSENLCMCAILSRRENRGGPTVTRLGDGRAGRAGKAEAVIP
jgi:hypothetical protein